MKKRILHINTKELGGAAKAALRLHEKFSDVEICVARCKKCDYAF